MASETTETSDFDDTLRNLAAPKTSATLTIRVIKSFEFRTERSLVLHDVNLEAMSVGALKSMVRDIISTKPGWKPYRATKLDTLKLYTKAHGAKTSNLIINLEHDDWILDDDEKMLANYDIENETEISFFARDLYEQFKSNPEVKWG